ncbi:MAG TPA: pilus assembly protein, partial [Anaerolineales bacterium]|nr:pilus assembly protein [Anaerolineales bacterium]HMX75247.1 pilus assembly protein [Anaerolineales bacterium]HMZ44193.1 pilus assembly protein [Anaerolineales bacterium]HND92958.1 pilus assembly protein [Anaerolineales bacterium]HNF35909.1 pilus assembly protein [Anaerolineales bacterium]
MKSFFSKLLPPLRTDAPRKRKTLGQSLIEFAIALPVLVLILTAMMEFGFILNFYLSLLDATRGA